jgi:DNA-binding transcriptional MerR regulator
LTKGPNAFRTISEAADEIGVQQHVLRFWETKFAFIRPMKRAGGRRFYRPQDIVVLKGVKALLYDQGYKIEGVQKLHREKGVKRVAWAADPDAAAEFEDAALSAAPLNGASVLAEHAPVTDPAARRRLQRALEELEAAKAKLDAVLRG